MIQIFIPSSYREERIYVVEVLFQEYLGLDISIKEYSGFDYLIVLENGNAIHIRDYFFSKINSSQTYLNKKYIPKKIKRYKNSFIVEKDIPAIYGTDEFSIEKNKVVCGIDVFASSFFMLTRWEEYVNKVRDEHDRFPATASLAYKNNFLNRPIVNEYVEMIWNIMEYLEIRQERKNRKFQFINTHDIDHIYKWKNLKQIVKVSLGDILKRKNFNLAYKRFVEYFQIKLNKKKDPFDTFSWLMNVSEKANIKSHFYFMSGGVTKYDNKYKINENKAKQIMKEIKRRGHVIGFHPSYDTYNCSKQFMKERSKLESVILKKVTEGRQHYLKFETPFTWQIWEDNGMEKDLTLSFADKEGFRCGTCYEFPVFNFLTKNKLNLLEYPLIAMEATFITYQDNTPDSLFLKIRKMIDLVKKYNGNFVFLWHNSSFNDHHYRKVYKAIIKYASYK